MIYIVLWALALICWVFLRRYATSMARTILGLLPVILIVGFYLIASGPPGLPKASFQRMQASQIEQLNVAVYKFRNKYKCLPGDCEHISDHFDAAEYPNVRNGNGNGILEACGKLGIDGFCDLSYQPNYVELGAMEEVNIRLYSLSGESAQFWLQLQAGEFINKESDSGYKESYSGCGAISPDQCKEIGKAYRPAQLEHDNPFPKKAFYKKLFIGSEFKEPLGLIVYGMGERNYFQIGRISIKRGFSILPGMTPFEAMLIDEKMDDGKSGTGTIVAVSAQPDGSSHINQKLRAEDGGFENGNPAACIQQSAGGDVFTEQELETATYAVENENLACSLRIRAPW